MSNTRVRVALAAILLAPLGGCITFPTYYSMSATYPSALVEVSRPKETKARWGAVEKISLGDSSRYVYEDSMVKVRIAAGDENVQFEISNRTDHSIKIIWDEASFIDTESKVAKVMHVGIKYTDRNQAQPPSIIPAHQTVDDGAWPNDRVSFDEGSAYRKAEWKHQGLVRPSITLIRAETLTSPVTPDATFTSLAKGNVGKRMGLILPLQIEGVTNEYTFWFRVTDAKVEGPTKRGF